MVHISKRLRQQVAERAGGYCEYCKAPQRILIELQIDHIIPISAGGETTLDNLCLTCRHCNEFKSAHQSGVDPKSGAEVPLFHPRRQQWAEHFAWDTGFTRLIGLTPPGRATIDRLRMNRASVVRARLYWLRAGWRPDARP